ncbi:hypothetical protein [Mycoplasmopsis arginini]|uniref:hypothetical protein n=1 Tax=Mycoplasmopsis arginini TaxID=2094 RepID=UPI0005C26A47|nr:hypothetical protein [Mycoplasmopsis arginini]BAQ54612.1 hypothetical protein MARG145_0682 [Mycoplasmopsis arginini]
MIVNTQIQSDQTLEKQIEIAKSLLKAAIDENEQELDKIILGNELDKKYNNENLTEDEKKKIIERLKKIERERIPKKTNPTKNRKFRTNSYVENILIDINKELFKRIQNELFDKKNITIADENDFKKFVNYKNLFEKVQKDIEWYEYYAGDWYKDTLDHIYKISKLFDGVTKALSTTTVGKIIHICKKSIDYTVKILHHVMNYFESRSNTYYQKVLPYFTNIRLKINNKDNLTEIITFIHYTQKTVVQETYGIWYTIINRNINNYINLFNDEYKISFAKYKENEIRIWNHYN